MSLDFVQIAYATNRRTFHPLDTPNRRDGLV